MNPRSVSAKVLLERGRAAAGVPGGDPLAQRRSSAPSSPGAASLAAATGVPVRAGGPHRRGHRAPARLEMAEARTPPGRGRVRRPRCTRGGRERRATSRPASAPRSCVCGMPTQTVSLARRMPTKEHTRDRRQAHEVVGLGRRGRRVPLRGQARIRALRAEGGRPRSAHRRARRGARRSTRSTLADSRASAAFLDEARGDRRRGVRHAPTPMERVVHAYGKSLRDLVRIRAEPDRAHPGCRGLPGGRGRGAGGRGGRDRRGCRAHPVRRRQQHLGQPRGHVRRDAHGHLASTWDA